MKQKAIQGCRVGKNMFSTQSKLFLDSKLLRNFLTLNCYKLLLSAILSLTGVIVNAADKSENIVLNPGFEEDVNQMGLPSKWGFFTKQGTELNAIVDDKVVHSGSRSFKVMSKPPSSSIYQRHKVDPGAVYTAEVYIKTKLKTGKVTFSVLWLGEGKWVWKNNKGESISGDNDWKKIILEDIKVPDNADSIHLGIGFALEGDEEECWVDDIVFKKKSEQSGIIGSLSLPKTWTVFAPFSRGDNLGSPDIFKAVPSEITVSGEKIEAKKIEVKDKLNRLDFGRVFGSFSIGTSALVFIPFEVPRDMDVTLGMGADWWMQAWLDGSLIVDTTKDGNYEYPPSMLDHQALVHLTKGKHVLAIKFIAGAGSAVLAVGGADDLRNFSTISNALTAEINVVKNGGVEDGADSNPFVPAEWKNGHGAEAFIKGELTVNNTAPLSGKRSLEINTLKSTPGKRKLYMPLSSVDVDTCYEVSFTAKSQGGDGYVTVSARESVDKGYGVVFIRGIGVDNVQHGIKQGKQEKCKAYYFFDTDKPCLVIQAHGPANVVLDDFSIVPVSRKKMWSNWNEQKEPRRRDWNLLTEDVVTPHVAWAKPYSNGKLKVLSLMSRSKHRLTVELAQRLSMEYLPVFFEYKAGQTPDFVLGNDYWIYDENGDPELFRKKQDTVSRLSQPVDCMVIADINATAIPSFMTDMILEKVFKGTGLVISGRNDFREAPWNKAINNENKTVADADWVKTGTKPVDHLSFYQYGKGLIAFYSSPKSIDDDRASLEDNLGSMIKSMLWASRKLPDIRIQEIQMPGQSNGAPALYAQIKRDSLPGQVIVSIKSSSQKSAGVSVTGWIDNYDGTDPIPLGTVNPDGNGKAILNIPKLAAGSQRVHFQVKNGNMVEDFSTAVLDVISLSGIKRIELDRKNRLFTAGDSIKGHVVLNDSLKTNQRIRLKLIDADGRIWINEEQKTSGKEIAFSLKSNFATVLIHRIRAEVLDAAGQVVDANEVEFAIEKPGSWYEKFFDYQIWVIPDSYLACRELRKYGVTSAMHERIFRNYALNNIRGCPNIWIPDWGTKIVGDKSAPIRKPCLNDPAFREKMRSSANVIAETATPLGAMGYSLAHEWCARSYGQLGEIDYCFCPNCQNRFQLFVKQEYGTVAKVNKAWKTDFINWEDIKPIVLQDALKNNQIVRWIDHRRYIDYNTAGLLKLIMDTVNRHHPGSSGVLNGMRNSLETFDSYTGVDYWRIYNDAKLSGCLDVNPSLFIEFIPREKRHLVSPVNNMWIPIAKTINDDLYRLRQSAKPWKELLNESHGFSYFEEYMFYPPYKYVDPILNADLTLGVIEPANKSVTQIRNGIGHFVFESKRDCGIAVLYSRSSTHVAKIWQGLNKNNATVDKINPAGQREFFFNALAAYGFTMVSDEQVSKGILREKGYRMLILPFSQAISPEAAEMIRSFVKNGGKLLADIRPGMTNLSGEPAVVGLLDDVFGVLHNTDCKDYNPIEGAIKIDGTINEKPLKAVIKNAFSGSNLKINGAEVKGKSRRSESPTFLLHHYGKGEALLMNCVFPTLDVSVLKIMDDLFNALGAKPFFTVKNKENVAEKVRSPRLQGDQDGATFNIAEAEFVGSGNTSEPVLRDYINGKIHCFGFYYPGRRGMGIERLEITPPVAGHIYNLRNNKYLGRKERFEISFPLEDVAFYASVPYEIQKPELKLASVISPHGLPSIDCLCQAYPEEAANENHVLRFNLTAPDGTEWKDFAETETAVNGKVLHKFVLPLNAPAGKWKVTAREAISGLEDSAEISLSTNK